jgi:hypothetical protein
MTETIVIGVVYPPGAGGGRFPPEETWTLRFTLQPWRRAGAECSEHPLRVRKVVSHEELDQLMGQIKAYQVARLRVIVSDTDEAVLVDVENAADSDPELREAAAQLQVPKTQVHPMFGVLTLNRLVDWWEADAVWVDRHVRLHISQDEKGRIGGALRTAASLWSDQRAWSQRITSFAVEKLLPLKNESWLDEHEQEVASDEFSRKMSLQSVTVYDGGAFEFSHDDGDLFWGHCIQVTGDIESGPTDANIAG